METIQRKKRLLEIHKDSLIYKIDMDSAMRWPVACIKECGPATMTFAGLREITSSDTFTAIKRISEKSLIVPKRTTEKHLKKLCAAGWIDKKGRTKTPTGRLRRTIVHSITDHAKQCINPYILYYSDLTFEEMRFSEVVIYNYILTRLFRRYVAALRQSLAYDHEWFESLPSEEPGLFRLSLNHLQETFGFSRKTIVKSKERLSDLFHVIDLDECPEGDIWKPIIW